MARINSKVQRVRSIQFLLIAVGGVLIVLAAAKGFGPVKTDAAFDALWDGKHQLAAERFDGVLGKHPENVPARLGRMIANLEIGLSDEAEADWAYLQSPPENAPPGVSRLKSWEEKHVRENRRFEGALWYGQARLTAERLFRARRRGLTATEIERARAEVDSAMTQFQAFIDRRPSGGERDEWTLRYRELERRVASAPVATDVDAALSLMESQGHNPREERTEVLHNMLAKYLDRAVRESPESLNAWAWRLLVLAELARRGETVEGAGAITLLDDAMVSAAAIRRIGEGGAAERARYEIAMAQSLRELAAHHPEKRELLLGDRAEALARATAAMAQLPEMFDGLPGLRGMHAQAAE